MRTSPSSRSRALSAAHTCGALLIGLLTLGVAQGPAVAVFPTASCPVGTEPVSTATGLLCASVFTASGTFTTPAGVNAVDVVVVGGGGGGGAGGSVAGEVMAGGGGGGGQVALFTGVAVSGDVTVTVGAGGAGGVVPCTFVDSTGYSCPNPAGVPGGNGGASAFGASYTAQGGFGGAAGSIDGESVSAGTGGASPTSVAVGVSGGGSGGAPVNTDFGFTFTYNGGGGGAGSGGNGGNGFTATTNCREGSSGSALQWICGGNSGPGTLPTGGNIDTDVWTWFDNQFGTFSGGVPEFGFGPGGAGAVAGLNQFVMTTSPSFSFGYDYDYDSGHGTLLDGTVPADGGWTFGARSFSYSEVVDGAYSIGYLDDGTTFEFSPGAPNGPNGDSVAWIDLFSGRVISYGGGGSGGVGNKQVLYGTSDQTGYTTVDDGSDATDGIVIAVFPAPGGNETPTTISYTGGSGVVTPGTLVDLSYTLSPEECDDPDLISYYIAVGESEEPIPNPLDTTGAPDGIYEIIVRYEGNANCLPSEDRATLVIGGSLTPGSTTGGGTYDADSGIDPESTGNTRVHFGFTVQKSEKYDKRTGIREHTQRGQLLWINNHEWRLKASLYARWTTQNGNTTGDSPVFLTTPCPPSVGVEGSNPKCGSIMGRGVLQRWNSETSEWDTATEFGNDGIVSFSANIGDGGSVKVCKQKRCTITDVADWLGLRISGVSVEDGVPVADPVPVRKQRNGSIVIRS